MTGSNDSEDSGTLQYICLRFKMIYYLRLNYTYFTPFYHKIVLKNPKKLDINHYEQHLTH